MNEKNIEPLDLRLLEKRAFRSAFEDGLWDIFFGMIFLGLGMIWTFSFSNLIIAFIIQISINIAAVLILKLLKKFITTPRLGNVKFGKKRKKKKIRLKLILSSFVVLNIIILFFTLNNLFKAINIEGLLLLMIIGFGFISIPFIVVAYFMDFKRLYFIAIIGGFSFFLFGILDEIIENPWSSIFSFVLIGSSIIIWGLILFYKFLKRYPHPDNVEINKREKDNDIHNQTS
ncbi:MAG: conserved membrane protein of unknown function [Promethearchaeota archaeon]|nr:MAG: conserved membrane protein of unknown function [Candidatus Lokiarchaeota archaeon]